MKKIIDGEFIAMLESRDLHVHHPMDGLLGGNRRSKKYGSSVEFADFREYAAGDDLRRIDWNLYARFEKLFLRLFVDERQLHHRIYLDASASMDWGKPEKSTAALKLAAALGFLSVKALDRVSYYAINDHRCRALCGQVVGREAFYRAADLLNGVDFYGEGDLGRAIKEQEDVGKGDGLSVIISDFMTDSDWKGAVDKLLYHKREVFLVRILSRDEVTPALAGKVFMLDSEAGDEEDGRNYRHEVTRSAVKAYEEAFLYHQKEIEQFCSARGVGFLTLQSDERIEKMLFMKATEAELIR